MPWWMPTLQSSGPVLGRSLDDPWVATSNRTLKEQCIPWTSLPSLGVQRDIWWDRLQIVLRPNPYMNLS